ncbi:unnamed protein product [Oppiella nova]|uniref:Uncharacterized protein n=1 Tax=Oppiella nova TaxID=334625 RepID=A0A7R9LFG3_9ACAR|nr:unnamed protein product [Oppiella nova]CAG2163122.1 unnamed protein product [Oppiella nova]
MKFLNLKSDLKSNSGFKRNKPKTDCSFACSVLTSCTLTTGLLVRHMTAIPGAPQYTGQAYECLNKLDPDINECLTKSYEYWHEPDQSISMSDDCCAKWDYIECSVNFLGAVNKSEHKCNESESNQLRQWFHKLEIFFANNSCSQYPKDSTFCLIPTLHNILITADKPPALNPGDNTCVQNIQQHDRLYCAQLAELAWNITKYNISNMSQQLQFIK